MNKILFWGIALALFGCGTNPSENSINLKKQKEGVPSLYPRIFQFKYINKKTFRIEKDTAFKGESIENIKPDTLSPLQRKKWDYDEGSGFTLSNFYYGATFYSIQSSIGDIQPIIVHGSSDDYDALVLININKKLEMVSWMEISRNCDGGPDSMHGDKKTEQAIAVFTHKKYSKFLNDSIFQTYLIKMVDYVDADISFTFDSIINTRRIERSGKFTLLKHDSIRVRDPYRKID